MRCVMTSGKVELTDFYAAFDRFTIGEDAYTHVHVSQNPTRRTVVFKLDEERKIRFVNEAFAETVDKAMNEIKKSGECHAGSVNI